MCVPDAQGQSYETLQKQIIELQSVLGDYLKKEEEAMELRIKYVNNRLSKMLFVSILWYDILFTFLI